MITLVSFHYVREHAYQISMLFLYIYRKRAKARDLRDEFREALAGGTYCLKILSGTRPALRLVFNKFSGAALEFDKHVGEH